MSVWQCRPVNPARKEGKNIEHPVDGGRQKHVVQSAAPQLLELVLESWETFATRHAVRVDGIGARLHCSV